MKNGLSFEESKKPVGMVMKQAIDAATYISYRVALEGIPPLKMPPVTMKKLDI